MVKKMVKGMNIIKMVILNMKVNLSMMNMKGLGNIILKMENIIVGNGKMVK